MLLKSFGWNPIIAYEAMTSRDDYVYCPFAYGYSNYARRGYAPHPAPVGRPVTDRIEWTWTFNLGRHWAGGLCPFYAQASSPQLRAVCDEFLNVEGSFMPTAAASPLTAVHGWTRALNQHAGISFVGR